MYVFRELFLRDGEHMGAAPADWHSRRHLRSSFALCVVFHSPIATLKDVVGVGKYCVMKRRLVEALRGLGETCLEGHAFIAKDRTGATDANSFCVVRPFNPVPCIDAKESEFEKPADGYVSRISKLVLNEPLVPQDRHFFQVAFTKSKLVAPPITVCSQAAKRAFTHLKARGAEFLPVDRYRI